VLHGHGSKAPVSADVPLILVVLEPNWGDGPCCNQRERNCGQDEKEARW